MSPRLGRRRKRALVDGPTPVPVPFSFRKHHERLHPFSRANLPPKMPVPAIVAKLQALGDWQLDELCDDLVVLLPLWNRGLPGPSSGPPTGTTTPVGTGDFMGAAATSGYSHTQQLPTQTQQPSTNTHSIFLQGTLAQIQLQVQAQVANHQSLFPTPSNTQPQPLHQHAAPPPPPPPPNNNTTTTTTTNGGYAIVSNQPSLGGGQQNSNNPSPNQQVSLASVTRASATENDALALAPDVKIWLPNASKKRNENRVRLARSFMAGMDGMKALAWDVTKEMERRWPLAEEW